MKAMKHTPGTWSLRSWDLEDVTDFAISANGRLTDYSVMPEKGSMPIASIQHCFNGKRTYANAQLIAAAPDMLAALRAIAKNDPHRLMTSGDIAREAIAKATGEAL